MEKQRVKTGVDFVFTNGVKTTVFLVDNREVVEKMISTRMDHKQILVLSDTCQEEHLTELNKTTMYIPVEKLVLVSVYDAPPESLIHVPKQPIIKA